MERIRFHFRARLSKRLRNWQHYYMSLEILTVFTQKALIIWHCQKKKKKNVLAPKWNTFVYIVTCVWMFDRFFVTNACFNTALPHCLFIEYEFQVCVCVSANDIKLVQALGNIIISLAMKHFLTLNMK